jgi:hypothetical protein
MLRAIIRAGYRIRRLNSLCGQSQTFAELGVANFPLVTFFHRMWYKQIKPTLQTSLKSARS